MLGLLYVGAFIGMQELGSSAGYSAGLALGAVGGITLFVTLVRVIVYCAVYACLDELHQMFVPRRTGSLYDSMLDTVGASVGTLMFRARRRSTRPPAAPIVTAPAEISVRSRG